MAIIDGVSVSGTTYGLRDNDTNGGIAPTFSASTAYTAGQYVWYDSGSGAKLYRFTADHAAGAWTGTDATEVKLGNDVSVLKSALDGAEVDISSSFKFVNSKRIRYDTGAYQGGSTYSAWKANQNFVNVDGYQYIKITMPKVTASSINGLAFYSAASESNYVSGMAFPVGEVSTTIEMTIPIPSTAKYVRTTYRVTTEITFSCKKIIVGVNEKLNGMEQQTAKIAPLEETTYGVNDDITSKFSFTNSKAIRATDGVYISNDSCKATQGFVNIEKYDLLKIKMPIIASPATLGLAFYSAASEASFVSGVLAEVKSTAGTREVMIPVPTNAKRVRTTYRLSDDFTCYGIIVGEKDEYSELYGKKANIINDLKTGNASGVSVISGTYGEANATYVVDIDKTSFRLAVDFQITENVNAGDSATDINVANVQANAAKNLTLTKRKPTQMFGSFQSSNNTYYQTLVYRSGFTCNGASIARTGDTAKPLVGNSAFSLWLQGSYADTEMSMADLITREAWLDTYQDLAIKIENDEISMIRDGIGTDGNEYNGGATSTLWTVSLKENDTYKTLGALYTELAALQEDYHFVLKFDDLSARKTCADLLQFGKMKLVGKYKQQIDTSGSTTAYYCDSYPCYFPFAIDETWHTLEVVKKGSTLYMAVDGRSVNASLSGKVNKVILDGRAVTFRNLEVNLDGSFGDAEVYPSGTYNHSAIISSRSPYIVPLMGHDMITTYQGSGVIPNNNAQQQSLTRVEDIILYAKKKGYAIVSLDQFHDMWVGRTPMPKRVAFFILDDMRVAEAYQNLRNRSVVTRNGATLNFATVDYAYNGSSVADANFKLFTSMRANGWCCASHSYRHDVRFGEKNSVVFAWELKQIMKDADKLNWLNDVIVANGAGGTQNQYNMMSAQGFCIVFHNDGYYDTRQNNPMKMSRTNIGDNTTGTSPYSILM